MGVGGWIADLFGYKDLYAPGNSLVTRRGSLRFLGGTLVDNPVTGTTDYTPPPSSVTTLAAPFAMPTSGGNVTITPTSIAALVAGAPIYIATAGVMSVVSVAPSTAVVQNTGASGNASPGATIAAGSMLVPGGTPGPAGAAGAGKSPVRLVQTIALPGSPIYSAGTITGSAALTTQFDGIGPTYTGTGGALSVGQRVFVRDADIRGGTLSSTSSGLYTVAALGVSSYSLTRATDLDSTADFVGGVQFDVLDGATAGGSNKGTRWALTNLGTVTLDATTLTWSRIGAAGAIYIYANQAPYSLFNDVFHAVNQQSALLQLAADLDLIASTLAIPAYALVGAGDYVVEHMVPFRQNTGLIGLSPDNTRFLTSGRNGGWMFVAGHDNTRPPLLLGHAVDTASANNKPWKAYDPSGTLDPWINLTTDLASSAHHCFLWTDRTSDSTHETTISQFEFACNFECESLGTGTQHIASCRGAKTSKDGVETCFRITLASDGSVQGVLRLHDETTGSYSAATVTNGGGGTSVLTGDGTLKPTLDTTFVLYIVTGGIVGVAGITFLYSVDGGLTFNALPANAIALGTSTSITIGYPDSPFFSGKFNLSAGTVVAGASYTITCSGVETSYTLNLGAGTVAVGNKYELGLQYDGSTIRLYCAQFGATITVGTTSNITTTAGHGGVLQRSYEELVVGNSMNFGSESTDTRAAQLAYGAIRIIKGSVTVPPSPCRTSIPGLFSSNQLCYLPFGYEALVFGVDNQLKELDGTLYGWTAARGVSGDGWADVYMRRINPGIPKNCRFENMTFAGACSGLLEASTANSTYRHLTFTCLGDQLRVVGPNQFSRQESLRFSGGRKQLAVVGGQGATLHGYCYHESGMLQCMTFASGIDQSGTWFLNPGADTRHCILLDSAADGDSYLRSVVIDGEELQGTPRPRELLRAYARHNRVISVSGNIGAAYGLPITWLGETDGLLDLASGTLSLTSARSCAISFEGSASVPIAINAASVSVDASNPAKPVPWTNVSGSSYVLGRGAAPAGAALATGNETLLFSAGTVRRMVASTTAGNTDKTLSVTGVREGDVWTFPIESQGNQVRFLNGGAAAGTLTTIAASTAARVYKFQALGGHLGLNWTQIQ